jgi:hypothetical protein
MLGDEYDYDPEEYQEVDWEEPTAIVRRTKSSAQNEMFKKSFRMPAVNLNTVLIIGGIALMFYFMSKQKDSETAALPDLASDVTI